MRDGVVHGLLSVVRRVILTHPNGLRQIVGTTDLAEPPAVLQTEAGPMQLIGCNSLKIVYAMVNTNPPKTDNTDNAVMLLHPDITPLP